MPETNNTLGLTFSLMVRSV